MADLERELREFCNFEIELKKKFSSFRRYGDFAFSVQEGASGRSVRPIDFWVSALVHGDEVIGLQILNRFLKSVVSGETSLYRFSMAFSLGNVPAAKEARRFRERDLNRSFSSDKGAWEVQRAHELSQLAANSQVTLDLHQTVEPSLTPFWIFPHVIQNFSFLQILNRRLNKAALPLVSFPLTGFSLDGKTLLEQALVNPSSNPTGFVVELGQKGFSEDQAQIGLTLVRETFAVIQSHNANDFIIQPLDRSGEFYQIENSVMNDGVSMLEPGLLNFADVHKGQVLARSPAGTILCPVDSKILFPKYGELGRISPELADLAVAKALSSAFPAL